MGSGSMLGTQTSPVVAEEDPEEDAEEETCRRRRGSRVRRSKKETKQKGTVHRNNCVSAVSSAAGAMSDHGNVIEIKSVEQWEAKLEEAAKEKKVIVVDFTATWCGPCKYMAPIFEALSKKHPDLMFLQVDVDKLHEVAGKWEVQAMPTFVFIKDMKLLHRIVGANKEELEKQSGSYAKSTEEHKSEGHKSTEEHHAHI
ncbi:unnamed protein product [Calypogeia fissa]